MGKHVLVSGLVQSAVVVGERILKGSLELAGVDRLLNKSCTTLLKVKLSKHIIEMIMQPTIKTTYRFLTGVWRTIFNIQKLHT